MACTKQRIDIYSPVKCIIYIESLHSDANYHYNIPIFIIIIILKNNNIYRIHAVHRRSKHPSRTMLDAQCRPCRSQNVGRAT